MNKLALAFTATLAGLNCAPTTQAQPRTPIQKECRAELSHLLNICNEAGFSSEVEGCSDAATSLDAAVTVLGMCKNIMTKIDESCQGQNIIRFKEEAGKRSRRIERIILEIREGYSNKCLFDEGFKEDTTKMNESLDEVGLPHVEGSRK